MIKYLFEIYFVTTPSGPHPELEHISFNVRRMLSCAVLSLKDAPVSKAIPGSMHWTAHLHLNQWKIWSLHWLAGKGGKRYNKRKHMIFRHRLLFLHGSNTPFRFVSNYRRCFQMLRLNVGVLTLNFLFLILFSVFHQHHNHLLNNASWI